MKTDQTALKEQEAELEARKPRRKKGCGCAIFLILILVVLAVVFREQIKPLFNANFYRDASKRLEEARENLAGSKAGDSVPSARDLLSQFQETLRQIPEQFGGGEGRQRLQEKLETLRGQLRQKRDEASESVRGKWDDLNQEYESLMDKLREKKDLAPQEWEKLKGKLDELEKLGEALDRVRGSESPSAPIPTPED
jgi:DNA repair exonuclease SbcCD ATPase subunit